MQEMKKIVKIKLKLCVLFSEKSVDLFSHMLMYDEFKNLFVIKTIILYFVLLDITDFPFICAGDLGAILRICRHEKHCADG
jgi:hypothetical protein